VAPIVINPLPGEPFGIGITAVVSADEPTWLSGGSLHLELLDAPETGRIIGYGSVQNAHSPTQEITLGKTVSGSSVFWQAYPQWPHAAQGKAASLRFVTKTPAGDQIDAIQVPVTVDMTTGLQIALPKLMTATPTGGLTPAQATQLQTVHAGMAFGLGGGFLPALPDLFTGVLPFGYSSELITPDRTGEGELSRAGGVFGVNALGLRWQVQFAPPGIGIDPGAPASYEIDILELGRTKQLLGGQVIVDDSKTWRDSDTWWIWNFAAPHSIRYAIAPGVVVRFWWVLFGGPGAERSRRRRPARLPS
jgi:hypothetical protein